MDTSQDNLNEALSMWDQAGERPYEVLMEYGLYDLLLNSLTDDISGTFYRGSPRCLDLEVGDVKVYSIATAWTESYSVATNFVYDCDRKAILVLEGTMKGIYNYMNTYDEDEVILAPMELVVTDKEVNEDGITLIYCRIR